MECQKRSGRNHRLIESYRRQEEIESHDHLRSVERRHIKEKINISLKSNTIMTQNKAREPREFNTQRPKWRQEKQEKATDKLLTRVCRNERKKRQRLKWRKLLTENKVNVKVSHDGQCLKRTCTVLKVLILKEKNKKLL